MSIKAGLPGRSRASGLSYQQLLDSDNRPVPEVLRIERPAFLGAEDKPVARYLSPEFHDLEVERLWRLVWSPTSSRRPGTSPKYASGFGVVLCSSAWIPTPRPSRSSSSS